MYGKKTKGNAARKTKMKSLPKLKTKKRAVKITKKVAKGRKK